MSIPNFKKIQTITMFGEALRWHTPSPTLPLIEDKGPGKKIDIYHKSEVHSGKNY